jgi:hypothetical protein
MALTRLSKGMEIPTDVIAGISQALLKVLRRYVIMGETARIRSFFGYSCEPGNELLRAGVDRSMLLTT